MIRVLILGGIAALLTGACQQPSAPSATSTPKATAQAAAKPATPPTPAAKPATPPTPAAKPATTNDTPPPERAEAIAIYQQRCVTCHGSQGKGDGPAAAALTPKPRSFADAAWQKTVDDPYLANIIVKGGVAVGKSALMPPNPDLATKPKVVTELVKILRSYVK